MPDAKQQLAVSDTIETTTAIIQVIERAAANPNIDVDKMERLLQMQERIMAKNAESVFTAAMVAAQSEMRQVSADANNPQTRSKYASYSAIDKAMRPIYTKHGFALSYDTGRDAPPETVRVLCYVSHSGGHTRTYNVEMPADGKGAKGGDVMTKTHAAGAAMQYGMRYLIKLIFNIAVGDDNDGNAPIKRIDESQLANLRALIEEVKANTPALLKYFKVEKLDDLSVAALPDAISMLEAKRKRAAK
jgi:hypothetical protein